ncbi:hypothetical protein VNO77_24680 [Canavalia gladiata]|uniref:Uncharacterized protein n=1 Tax=Canavalia gladiata TaxID=3824 RepID=A0AAN9QA72_CANGL
MQWSHFAPQRVWNSRIERLINMLLDAKIQVVARDDKRNLLLAAKVGSQGDIQALKFKSKITYTINYGKPFGVFRSRRRTEEDMLGEGEEQIKPRLMTHSFCFFQLIHPLIHFLLLSTA